VLKRIFGPKIDEVTVSWKVLHNGEFHKMYSSPSIIRMVRRRKERLAENVAEIGRRWKHMACWWESQKERDY
jgi:hypothetical protein